MGVAAHAIARLLHRYRWIGYVGLVIVLYVALHMMWEGHRTWSPTSAARPVQRRHARLPRHHGASERRLAAHVAPHVPAAHGGQAGFDDHLRPAEALAPLGDLGVLDLAEQHLRRVDRPAGLQRRRARPRRPATASGRERLAQRLGDLLGGERDEGLRDLGEQRRQVQAIAHRHRGPVAVGLDRGPGRGLGQVLVAQHPQLAQRRRRLAELAVLHVAGQLAQLGQHVGLQPLLQRAGLRRPRARGPRSGSR